MVLEYAVFAIAGLDLVTLRFDGETLKRVFELTGEEPFEIDAMLAAVGDVEIAEAGLVFLHLAHVYFVHVRVGEFDAFARVGVLAMQARLYGEAFAFHVQIEWLVRVGQLALEIENTRTLIFGLEAQLDGRLRVGR